MSSIKKYFTDRKREYITLLAVFVIAAFFTIINHSYFSWNTLTLIFQNATINGTIAVGMTFAIMVGGIDLSVGSTYGIVVVFISWMTAVHGINSVLALIIGLITGCLMGMLNGFLVTKMKLQPFIATLGTVSVFRGIAYVVTGGIPISGVPESYRIIFNTRISKGIYVYIFVFIGLTIVMGIVLGRTKIGHYMYAVGGNSEAAKLSGVNVDRVIMTAYIICAFCAAIAGAISLSNLGSGNPTAGDGYELDAIAACAVGGSRMAGGKGSILGTFFGALLLAALRVGMIILNVDTFYQYIVTGIVIVIAAFLEVIQAKFESRVSKIEH